MNHDIKILRSLLTNHCYNSIYNDRLGAHLVPTKKPFRTEVLTRGVPNCKPVKFQLRCYINMVPWCFFEKREKPNKTYPPNMPRPEIRV